MEPCPLCHLMFGKLKSPMIIMSVLVFLQAVFIVCIMFIRFSVFIIGER